MGLRHGEIQTAARSIIFVAHSLGGLVCPEVVRRSQDIMLGRLKRTGFMNGGRRIAFPGTPHQGSDNGKWLALGKNFLSTFSEKTTADILKELEQGSETLVELGFAFQIWLSHRAEKPKTRVEIVCFFEELTSSVGGKSIGKERQLRSIELDSRLLQARLPP